MTNEKALAKKKTFTTNSAKETQALVNEILSLINSNVIGLIGDLGAGKTTFVQGLAKHLGIDTPITSPTFMILKSYSIKNHPKFKKLIHIDAYRVNSWDEIVTTGIGDIWNNPENLVVIEWAENIKDMLPQSTNFINFEHKGENTRTISLSL